MMNRLYLLVIALGFAQSARAQDINDLTEKAVQDAAAKVAPSVVKIETAGGSELVGGGSAVGPGAGMRKGVGPTTGVVVDAAGYIITSSFNFANKPTDIFVTVPGQSRLVAKVVATDQTRMLTLLKIDASKLPVPVAVPREAVRVGQWSVALGRTLDPNTEHPPSVSVGIVSAVNRVMGKAIQTDAKVSPVNYGGPLVAVDGRVLGVLVPASTRGETELAGVEWYDSGIGFAIPFSDVLAVFPRLKVGKDLRRGLLGITPQGTDVYGAPAIIGSVLPDSAAAKIGLKVGDKISKLDGKPVPNYSALMHILGPKYEGDSIPVQVVRDGKEIDFPSVVLSGTVTAYAQPFFGILPIRDDPEPGVEIRHVYPKSPADEAKFKAGDRIMKLGPAAAKGSPLAPVNGRAALALAVAKATPGTEVKVEVKRKEGGKTETVTLKLAALTDQLPAELPLPSSAEKALESPKVIELPLGKKKDKIEVEAPKKKDEPKKEDDEKKVETGLRKRTNAALGRELWVYVPENYDPNIAHGAMIWFHTSGKGGKDAEDVVRIWRDFCFDYHFILIGPKSQNPDGWVASETEAVMQDVKTELAKYTIDRSRVAAHGMGVGGQMAVYVAFNARDTIRGVAAVGAVLGTQPKDTTASQPLAFFLTVGDKDPLLKDIQAGRDALREKKFPTIYHEMKEAGKEYLDIPTFADLQKWFDSLDRI